MGVHLTVPIPWVPLRSVRMSRRSFALVTAVVLVTGISPVVWGSAHAKPAGRPPQSHSHRPACGPTPPRRARCHAEVVTAADAVTPLATTTPPSGAYRPADLQSAY